MEFIKQPGFKVLDQIDGKLVTSYRRHPSIKSPKTFLDDLEDLDVVEDDIADIIELSDRLYHADFICGAALDILNNFATTKLYVEPTGNKKFDRLVEVWSQSVNYDSGVERGVYHLMQRFGLGYLRAGNVFPLKVYEMIDVEGQRYSIPMRVSLLNPLKIRIHKGGSDFGPKELMYMIDDDMLKTLQKDTRKSKPKQNIPVPIRRKFRNRKTNRYRTVSGIKLDPRLVTHIKRKSLDFEDWGVPYLSRAFRALSTLNKLIRLDEATLDGLINLITIFKLGTDEFPAGPARIDAFARLLTANGAVEPNKFLVWQHDIDVVQVGPDGKILGFENRFDQAMAAVKIALGVPDSLLTGKYTGDPFPSFLSMLENLEELRVSQTIWLQDTLMQMAQENNIMLEKFPQVIWDRTNLVNDKEIKNLIISFWDRGLIDPETAIRESGRDWDAILQRKKDLKKSGDEELFLPPKLPFDGNKSPDSGPSNNPDTNKGRPSDDDATNPKDKNIDTSAFELAGVDLYSQSFDKIFQKVGADNFHDIVIAEFEQILYHTNNINDISRYYGIASECRKAIHKFRDVVLQSNNPKDTLESVKTDLWLELQNIRIKNASTYKKA